MVSEETKGKIMTLLQQLENRGILKGMQQGMQQGMHLKTSEIAKRMLLRGEGTRIISADTGLTVTEIEALKKELEPTKH
jgi:hypothetical protein